MEEVRVLVAYGGTWETNSEGFYRFSGGKTKGIMVPLNSTYIDLVDRVYRVTELDRHDEFQITLQTVYRAKNPTKPVNILNDDDVAFFLCETNALPIQQRTTLAITISQISTDAPTTQVAEYPSYFFHEDHDERNPMGFNKDTTFDHFNTEEDGHANTMGDDFANPNVNPLASDPELRQEDNVPMSNLVSRVVNSTVPPSSKTSLVAVDRNIDIEIGGLYHCNKQLRLHLGMVAMTKKFQYHVKRSTTDRFEAACIHNHCKWRIHATKLKNSDYFEVKSYEKAWRARESAFDEDRGSPEESYAQLPSYCYIGFTTSLRPVVAVDGTFLKGKNQGTMFVACCMDGNNQIYPLAFGYGDSENDASWSWFLTELHDVIGEPLELVIISDRHKSIEKAVRTVFSNSLHGNCIFHLSQNIRAKFKNDKVQKFFFKAAKAYRVSEFESYMQEKREVVIHNAFAVGLYEFQVKDGRYEAIVDLENKTRTCREFQLDQLPCTHAFAAMRVHNVPYEIKCSKYYKSEYLMTTYSELIHPVGDQSDWIIPEDVCCKVVYPPVGGRSAGRPHKQRIPSVGEEVVHNKCSRCKGSGHNRQTCKNPIPLHPCSVPSSSSQPSN
ncbi:hypothetical protein EZV62_024573 [Acer yangbiense]|uniref:SWIM-type domain-containing protein n=1 Tax=Acer yangbiense TaxID=1000413 RepID=A0A5C7GVG8_9ROSI|nr:hypothetical protein EZV62_024573 [Acer yangbiense]